MLFVVPAVAIGGRWQRYRHLSADLFEEGLRFQGKDVSWSQVRLMERTAGSLRIHFEEKTLELPGAWPGSREILGETQRRSGLALNLDMRYTPAI